MKIIIFLQLFTIIFFNSDLDAQLKFSSHLGRGGRFSREINNIQTIGKGRFERHHVEQNLSDKEGYSWFYEVALKYYLKNKYAVNLGYNSIIYNSLESFYWISFRDNNGFFFNSSSFFGNEKKSIKWINNFSLTLSKDMNLSNKFSLIPEIGLGLMSYNGHPENTEIFTVRKTIENQFLEFNGNLITSRIDNGIYIPLSLKISYQTYEQSSFYFLIGNHINLTDYHYKERIEYEYSIDPSVMGIAEYKYRNFKYFALGFSIILVDKHKKT
jgi:hypothetical protein